MTKIEAVKVRKVGDSLAATIPKPILATMLWVEGDYVVIVTDNNQLILQKVEIST